jgi:hypothetical protein
MLVHLLLRPLLLHLLLNDDEVIAVIAAAVAAASGSGDSVPALHIRASRAWTLNAHAEAISVRKECF